MSYSPFKSCIVAVLLLTALIPVRSQTTGLPEVFKENSIPDQFNYLEEKTRIYENYRAIREDMFRAISKNTLDTFKRYNQKINDLTRQTLLLNARIDSLNKTVSGAKTDLDEAVRNKESIRVIGINVNKTTYNSIMWSITGILLLLLIIGYFTFKQNRSTTVHTKKDLDDMNAEFEEYKKRTRLEREKTNMEHFNEIKKLKSNLPGSRLQ
jgi:hypothetical protein